MLCISTHQHYSGPLDEIAIYEHYNPASDTSGTSMGHASRLAAIPSPTTHPSGPGPPRRIHEVGPCQGQRVPAFSEWRHHAGRSWGQGGAPDWTSGLDAGEDRRRIRWREGPAAREMVSQAPFEPPMLDPPAGPDLLKLGVSHRYR